MRVFCRWLEYGYFLEFTTHVATLGVEFRSIITSLRDLLLKIYPPVPAARSRARFRPAQVADVARPLGRSPKNLSATKNL